MEKEKYMTLKELTELAQTPYATVKRDIDNGLLPAYKVGRKYFIAVKDGEKYAAHKKEILSTKGYTIKELQAILPLSYAFIIELIKSQKLHAIKSGRRYIIPHAEFCRFLKESSLK
ncbi:MAG: helix-turn-helix domain-containing protein [Firmicutes bacterium]|nr:helix-turn-helix domain-containing protein [Bacillota bacterium]